MHRWLVVRLEREADLDGGHEGAGLIPSEDELVLRPEKYMTARHFRDRVSALRAPLWSCCCWCGCCCGASEASAVDRGTGASCVEGPKVLSPEKCMTARHFRARVFALRTALWSCCCRCGCQVRGPGDFSSEPVRLERRASEWVRWKRTVRKKSLRRGTWRTSVFFLVCRLSFAELAEVSFTAVSGTCLRFFRQAVQASCKN